MATIIPDASIEGLQITNQAASGIRDSAQTIANMIHAKRMDDLAQAREFLDNAKHLGRRDLMYQGFGLMGLGKDYSNAIIEDKQKQGIYSEIPDQNGNHMMYGNESEIMSQLADRYNSEIKTRLSKGDYIGAQMLENRMRDASSLEAQTYDKNLQGTRTNYLSLVPRGGRGGSKPIAYTVVNKKSGKRELYRTTNDKLFLDAASRDKAFLAQFGDRAADYDPSSIQMQTENQQSKDIADERDYDAIAKAQAAKEGVRKKGIIDSVTDFFGIGNFEKEAREDIEANPYLESRVDSEGNVYAVAKPYRVPGYEDNSNVASGNGGGDNKFLTAYMDQKGNAQNGSAPVVKPGPTRAQMQAAANAKWERERKKAQAAYDKQAEEIEKRQLKGEINYARDKQYEEDVAKRNQQRKIEAIYEAVNDQVDQWIKDGYGATMTRKQLEDAAYRTLGLQRPYIIVSPREGEKKR